MSFKGYYGPARRPITTLDCVLSKDESLVFAVGLGPEINSRACLLSARLRLKCDGTGAETRFLLSAKRASPFKSAGASVQSTTGSRGVSISGSNFGYTTFRGNVKSTGYPLHSSVSPLIPIPCVTVCHHISTGLYQDLDTMPNAGYPSSFTVVTFWKLGTSRSSVYNYMYTQGKKWKSKLRHTGNLSATARLAHRLCYRPAIFFRHLSFPCAFIPARKNSVPFHKCYYFVFTLLS